MHPRLPPEARPAPPAILPVPIRCWRKRLPGAHEPLRRRRRRRPQGLLRGGVPRGAGPRRGARRNDRARLPGPPAVRRAPPPARERSRAGARRNPPAAPRSARSIRYLHERLRMPASRTRWEATSRSLRSPPPPNRGRTARARFPRPLLPSAQECPGKRRIQQPRPPRRTPQMRSLRINRPPRNGSPPRSPTRRGEPFREATRPGWALRKGARRQRLPGPGR
jgi:hypothetical protein